MIISAFKNYDFTEMNNIISELLSVEFKELTNVCLPVSGVDIIDSGEFDNYILELFRSYDI